LYLKDFETGKRREHYVLVSGSTTICIMKREGAVKIKQHIGSFLTSYNYHDQSDYQIRLNALYGLCLISSIIKISFSWS